MAVTSLPFSLFKKIDYGQPLCGHIALLYSKKTICHSALTTEVKVIKRYHITELSINWIPSYSVKRDYIVYKNPKIKSTTVNKKN